MEDCEIGVYNTEQLTKLLSVLDDDINVSVNNHLVVNLFH